VAERREAVTAEDFMSELAKDERYQRRKRKHDAEQEERLRRLAKAEAPIGDDLKAAGVDVEDLWDTHRLPDELRVVAVPVLIKHLQRQNALNTVQGLSMGLNFPGVRPWWDELRAVYLSKCSDAVRDQSHRQPDRAWPGSCRPGAARQRSDL
jgi:hypothetical protein